MKDSTFETGQITKLRQIERARMKRGLSGLRMELQELILRLQSDGVAGKSVAGKSKDPRETQAKWLWDKGWGRELGFDSFGDYLATISGVPEKLTAGDERFPELVLVDTRVGVTMACELLGVDYNGIDETFVNHDNAIARTEKVYWMRTHDGKRNRGKSVRTCRSEFAKNEFGLTVHEGLALFAQRSELFRDWGMDLPSSVLCERRENAASLHWFNWCPRLGWCWGGRVGSNNGSASRME